MDNYEFKFKRGTEVAAYMAQFHTLLKYTNRLLGNDYVQNFESKVIMFGSFPKASQISFLYQGSGVFDSCKLVDIYQHMDNLALSLTTNDEKNNKNKHDNGQWEVRDWTAETEREETMALAEEAKAVVAVKEVVEVDAVEEAWDTATTTIEEEVVVVSMEAEVVTDGIMNIRTTIKNQWYDEYQNNQYQGNQQHTQSHF